MAGAYFIPRFPKSAIKVLNKTWELPRYLLKALFVRCFGMYIRHLKYVTKDNNYGCEFKLRVPIYTTVMRWVFSSSSQSQIFLLSMTSDMGNLSGYSSSLEAMWTILMQAKFVRDPEEDDRLFILILVASFIILSLIFIIGITTCILICYEDTPGDAQTFVQLLEQRQVTVSWNLVTVIPNQLEYRKKLNIKIE